MMFLRPLLVGAATLLSLVSGYANPLACSGTCTNAHDPSIIRRSSDGTYFRFSTGNKIAIHTASTLLGPWTYKGAALPSGSSINLAGNQDLWAPDVSKVGDTYYLYYAVSTFGSQNSAIGVATSTTMDVGTWTDRGSAGVTSSSGKTYNAIDPNLVLAGSTYLLTFGSFWGDIYQVAMKNPPLGTAGSASYNVEYDPAGTHPSEGAFVYKYGSYYYLFFSSGICCGYDTSRPAAGAEYKIKVCRSTSATGGYVDQSGKTCSGTSGAGTVVLQSHDYVYGPGGQGVYNDPTYGVVIYYHYVDTRIGYADGQKQFGVNKLDWTNGWPTA